MNKTTKPKTDTETGATAMTAAMKAVSPTVMHAWYDIMAESAEFVMKRLQQDMETQRAILSCKNPAELMKIQSEFYQTAMKQYSEEAAHLFKMMSEATGDALKQAQTGQARSYDDVPL
ncbi:phasin family protein [Thalassococcus sp. CAU 1522]|uniref:Phasin family protein n=1 Tax=Thalassococcus arenae TaxID=2851652 RepID=A0ABS6N748_9RHOB|nr:phasin family protein [Thalassococcus arenae]MBV2359841.1 phasin family protein [Thalassococcus arenae]